MITVRVAVTSDTNNTTDHQAKAWANDSTSSMPTNTMLGETTLTVAGTPKTETTTIGLGNKALG